MNSNFDLDLKQIQLQNEWLIRSITELQKTISEPDSNQLFEKEFYTVEDAARLKGGASLNTYKGARFLLPGCGNPKYARYVGGRLCFSRDEVLKWIKVSDENYLEYAKECGVTVVPERFLRMMGKAKEEFVCS